MVRLKILSPNNSTIHQLKLSILLLALPCLALQCNKDDDDKKDPKDVTRLSEEFKSYAYFKEGSWWVYKELNSGNLDSAYVTRSDILIEHRPERRGGPENYEHLSCKVVREIYENDKDTTTIEGLPGPPNNKESYFEDNRVFGLMRTIYQYGISSNVLLYTPVDSTYKMNDNGVYIAEILDSAVIQGKTYHNIFITKHPGRHGGETNELIKSDYYAKNVGLIKRIYWDGRIKELIRHNVKQ